MQNYLSFFLFFSILVLSVSGCVDKPKKSSIIVGIASDIESTNPMFAFGSIEGSISELLYLSLVSHTWNKDKGDIDTELMLAKKLTWNQDLTELDVLLRDDVYWTDGKKLTAEDIVFSFDVYSDPETKSKFLGLFSNYYLLENKRIDVDRSFHIISPYHLKIKFQPGSKPDLFDVDYPIIPKHIFAGIERKELELREKDLPVVSNGPFIFKKWKKEQYISLAANKKSFLSKAGNISELIFKVVPDVNNRVLQLNKGELDLSENVRVDLLSSVKDNPQLKILSVKGRSYDFIGWNQIDPVKDSRNNESIPHPLFSNVKVRRALSCAINKQEILDEFLGGYGELASGPVSPIFKNALDKEISGNAYNPDLAMQLLHEEGWIDKDQDGILEKNGKEFSFELSYLPDKPYRKNALVVIKNNLYAAGINVNIVPMEKSVFIENVFSGKLDAWLSGWTVPVPIDLSPFWHSDKRIGHLNLCSYKNKDADLILEKLDLLEPGKEKNELLKKFTRIISDDEPFTFLYWTDNIVVVNKNIKNIDVNPLGVVQRCWDWKIDTNNAKNVSLSE